MRPPEPGTVQDPRCGTTLRQLLWFTLSIAAISGVVSAIAAVWIDLPWGKIFRRCVSLAALLTLWLFTRPLRGHTLQFLGLADWVRGRPQLLRGALLGFGAMALLGTLYLATGACLIHVHADTLRVWSTLVGFLPAAGLIAVLEESIFRGYVLKHLLACSKPIALVGSSAAYALVHLRPHPVWPASGFELVGLFLLGWILALGTLRSGSLYLAIGLHGSLAYCARVNKLLLEFPGLSLQWLVGTNRLVNGVAAWLALLGIGWIITRGHMTPQLTERERT